MKIAIRADGGSKIGMGHIMRTLVLAKELAKTNDVFYICKNGEEYLGGVRKVKEEGFEVKLIDGTKIVNQLIEIKADVLITDSYDVDEEYFINTKPYYRKTIYIDDLNDKYYDVDIIINQNIGTEDWKYRTNPNCKLLLGTKYAMLREEFRNENPIEIKEKVENVLITMGGADPLDATKKIINMLKESELNFHIIIGNSFKDIAYFKNLEKQKNSKLNFYYNPNMLEVMKKCDIAIAACGSTIYELAALGIPTLGVVVADNQARIASIGNDKNILINLDHINELEKEKFVETIKTLYDYKYRQSIQEHQIERLDKKGVYNIVDSIGEHDGSF